VNDPFPIPDPMPPKHGVIAILQDDRERYLTIQRGLTLTRAPGWWCFPGGEVEPGETLDAAIRREMLEELSLAIVADAKIHQCVSPNNDYLLHWFRVSLAGPLDALRPHAVEVAQVRWLSAAEILNTPNVLPGLIAWLSRS
jgi:8-oxo-dGTP pyrophosphatase MutT (NUDIX family)